MSSKNRGGCRTAARRGCVGCALIVAFVVVVGMVLVGIELSQRRDPQPTTDERAFPIARDAHGVAHPGRLTIEGDIELTVTPAPPGTDVTLRADYDTSHYELQSTFDRNAGDDWDLRVELQRDGGKMRILPPPNVAALTIAVPEDVPIEIAVELSTGSADLELGGTTLRELSIDVGAGHRELSFDRPVRRSPRTIVIDGDAGSTVVRRLGNASPSSAAIRSSAGSVSVDLGGAWTGDADVEMTSSVGSLDIFKPDPESTHVVVEQWESLTTGRPKVATSVPREDPRPVLSLRIRGAFAGILLREPRATRQAVRDNESGLEPIDPPPPPVPGTAPAEGDVDDPQP